MTVQTGEFILLTGRSGCGKTTLIRSLNGLIPHFYPGEIQGDLLMDGHSLLEMKPSELAGQVGTVFQDPRSQFFMTDTTRELAFGCENLGLPREETIDRIAKAAKELELVNYLNRSIFALSSGEKQQIAIGSVYALGPKVYIFDEPSANLDYGATKRLAEIMEKQKAEGGLIILDTPPCGILSDASILAKYADACLFVVRYDYAKAGTIRNGMEEIAEMGTPFLGGILNMAPAK